MTSDTEIIAELKRVILDGLTRLAPHKGPTGSGLIFDGSFDWHSSVHAHWALLSMARVSEDEDLRQKILERLSDENLAAESKYLRDEPNAAFEMPYGRAWLCLLLAERARHVASTCDDAALLHREVAESVALWLEQNANSQELTRCGSHQSWLFAFLLLKMSAPEPPIQQRLDALQPRIESVRPVVKALESAPAIGYDFLHLPAILSLIDASRPHAEDAPSLSFSEVDEYNCHQCGANAVRLWPHAHTKNAHFREGLDSMLERPEQWRDDFRLVSHWVPQFVWLALLLERGELI